jgi:hypothetical protein
MNEMKGKEDFLVLLHSYITEFHFSVWICVLLKISGLQGGALLM